MGALWKSSEDDSLISTLCNAFDTGQQAESGWKPQVWTAVIKGFEDAGLPTKTVRQCKDRWQKLKKQYRIVKAIRNTSGFGWDDTKKMATATAEVWDAYIEAHPEARPFRKKGFPLYDKIKKIVDPVIATGSNAVSAGNANGPTPPPTVPEHDSQDSDEEHDDPDSEDRQSHAGSETDSDRQNSQDTTSSTVPSTPLSSSNIPNTSSSSVRHSTYGVKRKRNSRVSSSSALDHLAENVGNLISTLQEPQSSSPARKNAAWKVIMEEEDLSDTELAAARKIFRGRAELADEYLSFPPAKKRARTMWLREELREILKY